MNLRFQNALDCTPQQAPPVWLMRQAGRYHSHYRKIRENHEFIELCKLPELAAEIALGPVEDFDFDAAILFSDLLFPLEALGMGLSYPGAGPRLSWYLNDVRQLADFKPVEDAVPGLLFQKEALEQTRARLSSEKSLIGFVGGPFTLFAYAAEGTHGKGLIETKRKLHLFDPFCERLVPLLAANIRLQIEGGAELVMIFDTAAGELSPLIYRDVVVPRLEQLVRSVENVRVGYYSKGTQQAHFEHPFFSSGALAGIGVDHRSDLKKALRSPREGFLQGNFDEALLHMPKESFRKEMDRWLSPLRELSAEERAGWICGLGHGVLPATPEENVREFVTMVRKAFS